MSNNFKKCTMCDTVLELDLNQPKTKCPCCGTEFDTNDLAIYGNCMYEENLYEPLLQDTVVPKSYLKK